MLQDSRFALDKDEQTTFIDREGRLNPKAVKWSEVRPDLEYSLPPPPGSPSNSARPALPDLSPA